VGHLKLQQVQMEMMGRLEEQLRLAIFTPIVLVLILLEVEVKLDQELLLVNHMCLAILMLFKSLVQDLGERLERLQMRKMPLDQLD